MARSMGMLRPAHLVRGLRGRNLFLADSAGIVLASSIALAFRYDPVTRSDALLALLPVTVGLLLVVRSVIDVGLGLYRRDWRHASVGDLERISAAGLAGTAVAFAVATVAMQATDRFALAIPRGFWPIELFLSLGFLGGTRFAIRLASDHVAEVAVQATARGIERHPTLLYGAGQVGVQMARSAARNPGAGIDPMGFLDDDPALAGTLVADLRVFGSIDRLSEAVARTGATTLLITMPSAGGSAVRRAVEAALGLGLEVRTVPAIEDLLDGSVDAWRVRRVHLEDLLRRPLAAEHPAQVIELFRDRVCLITGAAGSIGSELARQVHAIGPRALILVDQAESPLYLIGRELEDRATTGRGSGALRIRLANVADRAGMDRLISSERPDVILHAAAYKHVPMLEDHPSDGVRVNVGGTLALLDAAARAGVERFVLVSTDKAVRPSSVMGATKRIAEMLVADTARRTGRAYVAVRFGNVLGSAGSVVPIFQDQLEHGRPLSVTHPDMTRYFMAIPEAAWLILDAAALGRCGDLFVLDMGDPVRVLDLARDVIRLSGRDPDAHPIRFIGLRPGEKLHEELFYAHETLEPTGCSKVLRVGSGSVPADVRERARQLLALTGGGDDASLARRVHACARLDVTGTRRAPDRDGRSTPDPVPVPIPGGPGAPSRPALVAVPMGSALE